MHLGLDVGSSRSKGVLTDVAGRVLSVAQRPTPGTFRRWGEVVESEVEVGSLVRHLAAVIADLRRDVPGPVQMVAITGQMHGLMLTDRSLRPLRPFITWQDTRTLGAGLEEGGVYRRVQDLLQPLNQRTGTDVRPSMLAVLLPWLRQQGELPKGGFWSGCLATYLTSRLVGGEMVCDPTHAAASGGFDIYTNRWLEPFQSFLEGQDIPVTSLPRVLPSGTVLGPVCTAAAKDFGLSNETKVVLAPGDFQAALLGCGLRTGELAINVGTGAQVALAVEDATPRSDHEMRPSADGGYLACRTGLPGGRLILGLSAELRRAGSWSASLESSLDARALDRLSRQQVRWVPCTVEASTGRWSFGDNRASLAAAMPAEAEPEDLYLSLLRCLAETYARAVEGLRFLCPTPITKVLLAGGHLRHRPALRRLVEEAVSLPTVLSEDSEEAALGAATLGSAGLEKAL